MNISLQNVDGTSAVLAVQIEKADYQEKVEKALKTLRKQVNMPGFRKGLVPVTLIKKRFGKSVLAEEVDKLMQEKVNEYIRENKVEMLGFPLPKESKADFGIDEDFEFTFDIALAPKFTVDLSAADRVDYYDINVSDEMVDQQVKMYAQRAGKYEKVEDFQDKDLLKGLLAELDENGSTKEGGIQVEGAIMMPFYMKDEEQKAIFNGVKVNTVIVFNPSVAYGHNEVELASLLKIKKEEVFAHAGNFSFQIEEITRLVPGDLNQELFDQVLGEGKAHNEEEFRAQIKGTITKQFEADSDYKFLIDVRSYVCEKIGKLEFADELMKRIMLANNKEKGEEFVTEHYDKSLEELTWQLIKDKLVEANDIKVEQADIAAMAKEAAHAQFAQYGMLNVPDEVLENYSKEMLKKRDSVEMLVARAVEHKLAAVLKTQVTLNHKVISAEDFNKMFE